MRRSATLALAAALLLAGCAGGGTRAVSNPYASSQDPVEILRYLARGPDVRAVVVGNPTAAEDAAFEDAVTSAMNDRPWGPRVRFTTKPESEASPGYRLVAVFGAAQPMNMYALCEAAPGGLVAAPRSGRLEAAFCWNDHPISHTRVSVDAIASAEDPNLTLAVKTAMRQLFPLPRRQELDRDPCFPFNTCAGAGFGMTFGG
jgi:hypothetical protein